MKKTRSLREILIVLILVNLLFVSGASSTITSSLNISFSGTISQLSASLLHIEGNKIKDAYGNVVVLRGVNVPGLTGDSVGNWMGSGTWSETNCLQELSIIKSWGANCIRLPIAVDLWKFNLNYGGQAMHTTIDKILTCAQIEGLYVILDPHVLKSDASYTPRTSSYDNPLPYPPNQGNDGHGTNFSSIITSKADFVSFMADIALDTENHTNVLWETWNEPQGTSSMLSDYYATVVQLSINAIRATGATQPILVMGQNWGTPYVDLRYPSGDNGLRWFSDAKFNDSTGNLIIDAHNYRGDIYYGASTSYLKADIDSGLNYMDFYDQNYPIIVTEIGCNNGGGSQEQQYFDNTLSLLDVHGIGYCAWAFWDVTSYTLMQGYPSVLPDAAGLILQSHLK